MADPQSIQVKIVSTPKIVESFTADWSGREDEVQILTSGPEEDTSSYKWGLEEAVAVLTLIQGAIFLGEFAYKLYTYLKDNEDQRIIVQTPLARCEFVSTKELTEQEVKDTLRKLAGVIP